MKLVTCPECGRQIKRYMRPFNRVPPHWNPVTDASCYGAHINRKHMAKRERKRSKRQRNLLNGGT